MGILLRIAPPLLILVALIVVSEIRALSELCEEDVAQMFTKVSINPLKYSAKVVKLDNQVFRELSDLHS